MLRVVVVCEMGERLDLMAHGESMCRHAYPHCRSCVCQRCAPWRWWKCGRAPIGDVFEMRELN